MSTRQKFELFQRVALARDIPEKKLRRGDVATIVDYHPDPNGIESGYSLEVQNAIGETIEVIDSRRIGADWQAYYGREVVLLESFVEGERFRGISYRAANWLCVGRTQGRGRNDRENRYGVAVKDIYVYPLVRDFRRRLGVGV
ncbi:MAG: DUF4926 domain-containing protein [bacterium]